MKSFRKILLLLALVFTLAMTCVVMSNATTYKDDYFTYTTVTGGVSISSADDDYMTGEIVIPETYKTDDLTYNVVAIAAKAFNYCEEITSITIPESVTKIGDEAFMGCDGLVKVVIPESVKYIGNKAFKYCDRLTDITLPDVGYFGEEVFYGSKKIKSVTLSTGMNIVEKLPTTVQDITIGDKITELKKITNLPNLKTIKIGNGITELGDYEFEECTNLTDITFGTGITNIGHSAFSTCEKLENVYVPDIESWININFNTKMSTPMCFAENLYIGGELATDIVIPEGTTKIGEDTFYNVSSIKNVTLPDGIKVIEYGAFENAEGLETINLPDSLERIGEYAFRLCKGLTKIVIPEKIKKIPTGAFDCCFGLKEVTIPASVTSIASSAFSSCANIENVYAADLESWLKIDFSGYSSNPAFYSENLYFGGKKVTDVVIPAGVSEVKKCAFAGYENLKSVTIPDSVTKIGERAFEGTGLTSVIIPGSVETIGERAFKDCGSLENVIILEGVKAIEYQAFSGCRNLPGLTVPASVTSLGDYVLNNSTKTVHYLGSKRISSYGTEVHCIPTVIPESCYDGPYSTASKCQICADWIAKNDRRELHDFRNYKTNYDASCLKDGTKTAVCERYGCTIRDTIVDVGTKKEHSDSDKDGVCSVCKTDYTKGCGHICHKGGIEGFFYKIARFFWKLFKTNEVCSCGMYHY